MITIKTKIQRLAHALAEHLKNSHGEKIREGFSVVILGQPNVGKSSLMNLLMNRDVAIVSDIAGTTRDMIEASLDLGGQKVVFVDTAGLTQTPKDDIEKIGIDRAKKYAHNADLKLLVLSADDMKIPQDVVVDKQTLIVINKIDKKTPILPKSLEEMNPYLISVKQHHGIECVLEEIRQRISHINKEAVPLTRIRHRLALEKSLSWLTQAEMESEISLMAESLRCSVYELGRITGHVDVEDLLDVIFSDFCIGK